MKISKKLVIGFAAVIGLAVTLGIVGLFQVNAMNINLQDITNVQMVSAENTVETKYEFEGE